MAKSKLRQLVRLPWAADSCPWVGKLRTVLPLTNRDVIRDSAVQLGLTHQRGAIGVYSKGVVKKRKGAGRVFGTGRGKPVAAKPLISAGPLGMTPLGWGVRGRRSAGSASQDGGQGGGGT